MMKHFFPTGILFLIFFSSCSAPAQKENKVAGSAAAEDSTLTVNPGERDLITDCKQLHRQALKMDSIILQQTELNRKLAMQAIKAFTELSYKCPEDSVSPIYLIKTAQVAQAIQDVPQAKIVLDKCIADYPDFKDRPAALFLLAQLYDEVTYLNNEPEAKTLYQKIVDEYPKSPWAVSAKGALSFIGKSDRQIMEELKKKTK